MKRALCTAVILFLLLTALGVLAQAPKTPSTGIPTPSQFLGFQVGADRQLADYKQVVSYFKMLAEKAPGRIQLQNMGPTTLGNEFILAAISTDENMKNLKRYKEIAHKLADPRGLTQAQIDDLVREGKAMVLVTCNIHSTEIGSSQMAMEWAHDLVTQQDPAIKQRLEQVILLLVPSLNPDGQIMETDWYRKHLGTKYEGGRMPWLYHHYVGHDDNRDWYMLTQKETKGMNKAAYTEWFPNVWLDEHQMGSSGPRLFVPPYTDPIAPEVDPLMWRGVNVIGTAMAWRLEQQRKAGVVYGYVYDQYYPGAAEGTPEFKNVFGLLTEAASVRLATPIYLPNEELNAGGKGLMDYTITANFPNPWPGGWWRLRDIMDYERTASDALLETAAFHKADFMRGTAMMAQEQIAAGKPDEYWRIARQQDDPVTAARLAHLIQEHGAEVLADSKDFLIPTAQPYGKFIGSLLSTNRYPAIRVAPNAPILRPYDITAWTLPMMMNVEVSKVTLPASARSGAHPLTEADWPEGGLQGKAGTVYALSHQTNNSARLVNALLKNKASVAEAKQAFQADGASYPAGTYLIDKTDDLASLAAKYHLQLAALSSRPSVPTAKLREVRVGLFKPWAASMDEGWTRWLLEQYEFNMRNVDNKAIKDGNLNASYDVILFPDVNKDIIIDGKPKREPGQLQYFEDLPPEYSGGIGKDGVANLKKFVENGGTIITLASSGDLLADEFNIPLRNALGRTRPEEFSSPGSLLRVSLDTSNPVAYGMPKEIAAFVNEAIAYQTVSPSPDIERSVLAWYPKDSEDILLSGWIRGPEMLERRAAAVTLQPGKGKLVLFGFRVQNRAQTEGTFKLLFNAIQWAGMD